MAGIGAFRSAYQHGSGGYRLIYSFNWYRFRVSHQLTAFGVGVLCEPDALLISDEEGDNLGLESRGTLKKRVGRPVAVECEKFTTTSSTSSQSSGSGTETEPELLMEAPEKDYNLPATSGVAKERTCPICNLRISSVLALVRHIKSEHPDSRSYCCDTCDSTFNTVADLRSHVSIVHKAPSVHCKFCEYTTTTRSRMRQHVRLHTKGERCNVCSKTYPTLRALLIHKRLHMRRTDFQCSDSEVVFKSKISLATHCKGKHGEGYHCPCGARFDSPAQRLRHQKKCTH